MRKLPLILFLVVILYAANIAGQDVAWARGFGSEYNDVLDKVAIGKDGSVYVAGCFGFIAVEFTGGESYYATTPYMFIESDTLFNYGVNNNFLVKYDQEGNLEWALSIGGNNWYDHLESVGGLVYDSVTNHIYLAGSASGTVVIGSVTIPCTQSDVFLAKFDLDGNCVWGKNFKGYGFDFVTDMCTDEDGFLYLTGHNNSAMTIQSITVDRGGFLAKFDSTGLCLWARKEFFSVVQPDYRHVFPYSVKVFNHEIVVGGASYSPQIMVDTTTITDTNYTAGYNYISGFLAKFDRLGNGRWAKFFGSPCSAVLSVDMDASGNIYCGGWFQDTCYFDSILLYRKFGSSTLIKSNPSGKISLISEASTNLVSVNYDIQLDESGNCYVMGGANGPSLIKYTPDLEVIWIAPIEGGPSFGGTLCVCLNPAGSDLVVTGSVYDSVCFDSTIKLYNKGTHIYGCEDVFLAKFDGLTGIGTNPGTAAQELHLFPNPTRGTFCFRVPDGFDITHPATLSMTDLSGRTFLEEQIEIQGKRYTKTLNNPPSGFYIVTLNDGRQCWYGKLIVE